MESSRSNNNNNSNNKKKAAIFEGSFEVKVRTKIVNGVLGECKIPSQCPVQLPADDGVKMTPNQLFDEHLQHQHRLEEERQRQQQRRKNNGLMMPELCGCPKWFSSSSSSNDSDESNLKKRRRHYVVLGCSKTAMDSVVCLQTEMKIPPNHI